MQAQEASESDDTNSSEELGATSNPKYVYDMDAISNYEIPCDLEDLYTNVLSSTSDGPEAFRAILAKVMVFCIEGLPTLAQSSKRNVLIDRLVCLCLKHESVIIDQFFTSSFIET